MPNSAASINSRRSCHLLFYSTKQNLSSVRSAPWAGLSDGRAPVLASRRRALGQERRIVVSGLGALCTDASGASVATSRGGPSSKVTKICPAL